MIRGSAHEIQLGYDCTLSSAISASASALRRSILICPDVRFHRPRGKSHIIGIIREPSGRCSSKSTLDGNLLRRKSIVIDHSSCATTLYLIKVNI
jgi:hypothetical protein